jgi:hypothetical protein
MSVALEVPEECLLLGVGVDLSSVSWLKACSWGIDCDLLLSSNSSGSVGVFSLLTSLASVSPSCGGTSTETTKIWRFRISNSSLG